MKSKKLNPFESKILTVLIKRHNFWNTAEVARETRISWSTAEKYLDEMFQKGWIEKKGRSKIYWKVILPKEVTK